MLKGTPQALRNSSWHKRHTKKKASNALFRKHSIMSSRRVAMASLRAMGEAEKKFKAAQATESQRKVGISGWFSYPWGRFWGRIKSAFNLSLWPKTT